MIRISYTKGNLAESQAIDKLRRYFEKLKKGCPCE